MKTLPQDSDLKIGFVGLDSSHCIEYAALLNDRDNPNYLPGARVVAAYAGGSDDWELSISRVDGYREELQERYGIRIVDTIESVAEAVDAIMILSVDGRVHLEEFRRASAAGKPVYLDKPLAIDSRDAREIVALSKQTGSRCFSCSVWRYTQAIREARGESDGFRHAYVNGKWPLQPGRHGWYWYGIHLVEILYSAMGTGCESVLVHREGQKIEIITGYWKDGRHGVLATNRSEDRLFSGVFIGEEKPYLIQALDTKYDRYRSFLLDALSFFRGSEPPVSLAETVETIEFLNAAERSADQGGTINLNHE